MLYFNRLRILETSDPLEIFSTDWDESNHDFTKVEVLTLIRLLKKVSNLLRKNIWNIRLVTINTKFDRTSIALYRLFGSP